MIQKPFVKALLGLGLLASLPHRTCAQVNVTYAAVTVSSTTTTITSTTLQATATDESVLLVEDYGVAYASAVTIIKSGNTTSSDDSSFSDLNAAVAVQEDGTAYLTDCNITTTGVSANGVHTYEDGSDAYLYSTYIHAEADGGHGIYTAGGYIYGEDLEIYTYGTSGSAIATDKGGGTIVVDTATVYTYGEKSCLVYSTGNITVTDLTGATAYSPAACIDGSNNWTLIDPQISSATILHGVFQIVSTAGSTTSDNEASAWVTGGSVSETEGTYGLVFIANIIANLYLTSTTISIDSGILANVSAESDWGTSGENGGSGYIYLSDVTVAGDVYVSDISNLTLTLEDDTAYSGTINTDDTAENVTLVLDSSSSWTVTGTSYLTVLDDEDTTYSNIYSDGYTVYYDSSYNSDLNNQTISLSGGGSLTPS